VSALLALLLIGLLQWHANAADFGRRDDLASSKIEWSKSNPGHMRDGDASARMPQRVVFGGKTIFNTSGDQYGHKFSFIVRPGIKPSAIHKLRDEYLDRFLIWENGLSISDGNHVASIELRTFNEIARIFGWINGNRLKSNNSIQCGGPSSIIKGILNIERNCAFVIDAYSDSASLGRKAKRIEIDPRSPLDLHFTQLPSDRFHLLAPVDRNANCENCDDDGGRSSKSSVVFIKKFYDMLKRITDPIKNASEATIGMLVFFWGWGAILVYRNPCSVSIALFSIVGGGWLIFHGLNALVG